MSCHYHYHLLIQLVHAQWIPFRGDIKQRLKVGEYLNYIREETTK